MKHLPKVFVKIIIISPIGMTCPASVVSLCFLFNQIQKQVSGKHLKKSSNINPIIAASY